MITDQTQRRKRRMMFQMPHNHKGFTMLEILVALVIGGIFVTAIGALIIDQTQAHEDHQMKVMMQQDGRAALAVLTNELMLAGYSPKPRTDGGIGRLASVEAARIDEIKVTFDRNGNGRIKRWINHEDGSRSTDYGEQRIFHSDDTTRTLMQNNLNVFLRNVEAVRFLYAYDEQNLGPDKVVGGVAKKYLITIFAQPALAAWLAWVAFAGPCIRVSESCWTNQSGG